MINDSQEKISLLPPAYGHPGSRRAVVLPDAALFAAVDGDVEGDGGVGEGEGDAARGRGLRLVLLEREPAIKIRWFVLVNMKRRFYFF